MKPSWGYRIVTHDLARQRDYCRAVNSRWSSRGIGQYMRTLEDNAFLLLIIAVSLAFAWILLSRGGGFCALCTLTRASDETGIVVAARDNLKDLLQPEANSQKIS